MRMSEINRNIIVKQTFENNKHGQYLTLPLKSYAIGGSVGRQMNISCDRDESKLTTDWNWM